MFYTSKSIIFINKNQCLSISILLLQLGEVLSSDFVETGRQPMCHFLVNNYWYDGGAQVSKQPTKIGTLFINNEMYLAPNPANNSTRVHFMLNEKTNITLFITDMLGKTVTNVYADKPFDAGTHNESIPLTGLSSGIYFVHLKSNMISQTAKLSITKQ